MKFLPYLLVLVSLVTTLFEMFHLGRPIHHELMAYGWSLLGVALACVLRKQLR